MTSRALGSSSRRAPSQSNDAADVDSLPQSPPSRANKRVSVAGAVHDMERQDRDAERDSGFYEMQQRPDADGDVKLQRLQTMGVVQKLNKAASRSKLEGRVLLTQKLAIFFAAVGLALSIIEQETLWSMTYRASLICPEDLPCDGGFDFSTRVNKPLVCGVKNPGDKVIPCGPEQTHLDFSQSIKFLISFSVLLLAICLIYYYHLISSFDKSIEEQRVVYADNPFLRFFRKWFGSRSRVDRSTVLALPQPWMLAVELLVIGVHPFPYFSFTVVVELLGQFARYRIESLLLLAMFLRLYLVTRFLRDRSACRFKSGAPTLARYGITLSTKFLIKRTLHHAPGGIIITSFSLCILIAAYGLRIGEIALVPKYPEHIYFWNNIWLIMTTVTTVGYGDMYPRSHIGRLVCAITMISAMIIIALMTAALTRTLGFSKLEERLATTILLEQERRSYRSAAASLVQAWWRDKKRPTYNIRQNFIFSMDLFRHQRLKRVRARWIADTDSHSVANAIGQKLDKLMERLDKVGTQVTASVKKAAVVAPAAGSTRAGDQAMVDALNRISGRLEALETRLTDVSNELSADAPSVDDVVASIKNSELGSDITWIKKAISKVYKEMKAGDSRSTMMSESASAFAPAPAQQPLRSQPPPKILGKVLSRREQA